MVAGAALVWSVQSRIEWDVEIPKVPPMADLTLQNVPEVKLGSINAGSRRYWRAVENGQAAVKTEVDAPGPHVVIAFAAEAGPACFLLSVFNSRLLGIIRGVAMVRDLEEECPPVMQEAKEQRPAA